ncbi:MAG: N-acetylmuramoyl-L-alanine amidase family protein [Bacillota bacterium]
MARIKVALLIGTRALILIGIALISLGGVGLISKFYVIPAISLSMLGHRVVLDAGHGGVDGGSSARGVLEKEITLDVVLRAEQYLYARGVNVQLTRDTDRDVSGLDRLRKGRHRKDLEERAKIINKGTVAASIHVNSSSSGKEKGAVVFYPKGSEESKKLALAVLNRLGEVQTLNHDFPVPRTNLFILRTAKVPAVLVELGFISNQEDRARLNNPQFRQKLAEGIGKGIIDYLETEN